MSARPVSREKIAGYLVGAGLLAVALLVAPQLSQSRLARKTIAVTNQVSQTPLLPRVAFEPEELNAGELLQQESVVRTFRLRNRSDHVMEIIAVQATCDCTVVDTKLIGMTLMPQSEISIPVHFNSSTRSGAITSLVEVTLRSETAHVHTVRGFLKVAIIPDFVYEPRSVEFGRLRPGESATQTIRFRPRAFQDLQLLPHNTSQGPFEVVVRDLNITVTFRAPVIGHSETYSLPLSVQTTSPRLPRVTIPIEAEVVPDLEVIPPMLVFANPEPAGVSRLTIRADRPFRVVRLLQEGRLGREPLPLVSATATPVSEWTRNQAFLVVTNQTISKADRLEAELLFSHDAGRSETRSVFVHIKRLGVTNLKVPQ